MIVRPKSYILKWIYPALVLMLACSCGKLDNLDSDDFDFFGKNDKKDITELRQYSETPMSDSPLVEFLVDKSDKMSSEYEKHIRKTCDYAKLPYRAVNISQINANPIFHPSARVLCVADTKKLSQGAIDKLIEFVANGGSLFMPFATEDKRVGYLIGFKPEAEFETDIKAKGFSFRFPMLPNLKDQIYDENAVHFGYSKSNFTANIKVLATAISDSQFPLILENKIGKGKVIFYNTTMIFEKIDRGLLFSGIIKGLEGIPYPIANTSTIFLDDFPSPVYDIKSEPIKSEMNLTITDYVKKVWWPDMMTLAKQHNISYSAMICFDYKNMVNPPFEFDQWDMHKVRTNKKSEVLSDWLVRNVQKNGHELAFHGYNHVSLYKRNWKNPFFVGTALKAVQKKWEVSNFGPLPITYVPPSNIIDSEGLRLLLQGMPSLKYMCSVYLGETPEGGNREFDFDPYNPGLFDYPRTCDGFYMYPDKKYAQQSAYIFTGIWTHFVHPDDVYQIPNMGAGDAGKFDLRNGEGYGWLKTKGKNGGLFTIFSDYLKQIQVTYPQIRYVNAGEGGAIVNDWRASKFRHTAKDGSYTVEELDNERSLSDKQYWFMYSSVENVGKFENQLKNSGATFSKTPYIDGWLFSIYTNRSKIILKDLEYKTQEELIATRNAVQSVMGNYRVFRSNVAKYNAGNDTRWTDDTEANFKKELADLKAKMLSETKIDSVTWNKYAKYMSWEDRGAEVWEMLDAHNLKYPSEQNMVYSKELNKIVDYPDDIIREKWIYLQLIAAPNDKALLVDYNASYSTIENKDKITKAFVALRKSDKSFDTYLLYLKHLVDYNLPAALEEVKEVVPTEAYKSVASEIAWGFANNEQYREAYEWSVFGSDVDFATKMFWLTELKSYETLELAYNKHIKEHPEDYKSKAVMSSVLHELGRFKEAWILANSLPESPEKKELRSTFNVDVLYVEADVQQDLIDNHDELFLPEVKAQLIKTARKEEGNFITFKNTTESNKNNPSAFKNVLAYNFYDRRKNLHGIAATYSTMYKINLVIKGGDLDNVTHAIGGMQYQFNNPKSYEKLQYWARARAEYSDYQRWFYQFGMGANISRNKNYKSAEFKIFPAETGPAHSKRIYRMQLNIYQDYYFLKYVNASLSLEGNYYTASKPITSIKTGHSYEGSVTTKFTLDNGVEKKMKFLPFIEGSLSQASIGRATISPAEGYPYWIIDSRLYGGGGLGWKYGLAESNFSTRIEAGYFLDDYSANFQRYSGEVAYQIFDFTQITASFEVYAQSKFYSNIVQFGVKYNLKKRKKK